MRCRGFLAPLFLLLFVGCADESPDELSDELLDKGFVEAKIPKVGSDRWYAANYDETSFFVESGDHLTIRELSEEEAQDYRVQVVFERGSVRYVGRDHGEWIGGLYFDEWNEDTEPLLKGNIKSLLPIGDDLYVIEGLAHGGRSVGSIRVIRDYSQPKEPDLLVELPDAPSEAYVDQREDGLIRITIVGFESLMEFTLGDGLDVIERETFWGGLYPTSIVKHGDHLVIGIRSGVATVSPGTFGRRIRYFTPR